jgi:peroxiredoxin
MKIISILFLALGLVSFVPDGKYKVGDAVSDFSLKNVNGKMVRLADYPSAKGFILVFTCNHCPFAKRYQDRMNSLNKTYTPKGFPLLAISSNDVIAIPEDNFQEMVKRAKEEHYNFPYLLDSTQAVARAFNAVKTPHAFVLFKENNQWVIKYSGSIDDNGAEPEKATHRFVIDAVEALLARKQVPVSTTKSVGCGIKWRNS